MLILVEGFPAVAWLSHRAMTRPSLEYPAHIVAINARRGSARRKLAGVGCVTFLQ